MASSVQPMQQAKFQQQPQQQMQQKEGFNPYISPGVATRDYSADADEIYKAMKGFGTDEHALIAILGRCQRFELHQIDLAFRMKYGKLLTDRIREECSGNFQKMLCNVIQPPELTDAMYLHDALAGSGTDEIVVNEILGTRDGPEMELIKMAFVSVYRNGLDKMIKGDTSGKYETLCITLINGNRGKGEQEVDIKRVNEDAANLFQNPTDAAFIQVLGNSSYPYRMALREVFISQYGKLIHEVIKKQFSGNFRDLLTLLVTPHHEYFAEKLHKAMKGFGTDNDTLIRIVSTRYGVDITEIKACYLQRYSKSLFEAVKSETSGDYSKILVALIGQ